MNKELYNVTVLVLAAGRGTRMGGPKALMNVEGRPWWRSQSDRLDSVGLRRLWVVSREVDQAMSQHVGDDILRVVASPLMPMFESVAVGILSLEPHPPTAVFVLPVDVPVPDRSSHIALVGAGNVAVPTFGGQTGHPVMLAWSWVKTELLPLIKTRADRTALRLDQVISKDARRIEVSDPSVITNLNTPDDVQRWCNRSNG